MTFRRIYLRPGRLEREATRAVARGVPKRMVQAADIVSIACDARMLLTFGALWLYVDRCAPAPPLRFVSTIGITTALHHAIKRIIAQPRPDRVIANELNQKIGRPFDAMPSGHAMHAGAIASFAKGGAGTWIAAGGLAAVRVLNLAHWPSSTLIGFVLGVVAERATRAAFEGRSRAKGEP